MLRYKLNLIPLTLLVFLLFSTTGCVSKKKADDLQAQLAACEQEKAQLEASVNSWEQRFDRESTRWEEMEANVSTAIPQALGELNAERQRIVELVPEQVRSDVESYLDEYFSTVMRGFEIVNRDNADIKLRLDATYKALEAVGTDTRSISTAIDETLTSERQEREATSDQLSGIAVQLAEVVDQVVEFDQTFVNCKECDERLRLKRKEREAILGFHAELMADLASIQSAAQ